MNKFLESTKRTTIAPNECMVSFDVVSLFTSIPLELARETIVHLLDDFDLGLPPTATIELLDHCLSNFFQFNNCLYQQIKDTPMGSSISGLIAEAVLQRLERKVFADISPKFWKRYVDDTFVTIQENQLPAFHQLLNTALSGITFTMEAPAEN